MRKGIIGAAVAAMMAAGGSLASAQAPAPKGRAPQTAPQEPPQAPGPVQVSTSLNRTAVWVGDSIVWTVELTCAPNVDVIADDLAGDKLELSGLELAGSDSERETRPDGVLIHRVRYHLRTYEIGTPLVQAAPLTVRYYIRRPGQRAEDLTPAGKVQIPGPVLAWRSTIPEKMQTLDLREDRRAEQMPALLQMAQPIGVALVLVSIAPVVLWAASRAHAARRTRVRRPSQRATRNETRNALKALRDADVGSEAELREAYGQLNTALRRHVGETTGLPASALTAEEITDRLRERRSRLSPEGVADVLAECDRARYGPAAILPPSDRFRESVEATERLL